MKMKFYHKVLAVLMLLAVIALKWMDVDFGSNKGTQVKSNTTSIEEVVAEYPDLPNAIEIEENDEYMSEIEDLQNIREGKAEGTPVRMMTELEDLRHIQAESKKRNLAQQKVNQKKRVSNKTSFNVDKNTKKQVNNKTNEQNEMVEDKNKPTSIEEDTDTFSNESIKEEIVEEQEDVTLSSDMLEEDSSTGFYIDEDGNVIEFNYEE